MLGVVNEGKAPKNEPPVDAAYQCIVPALAVALSTTEPASQRESGVELSIVGETLTVATIAILGLLVQPLMLLST